MRRAVSQTKVSPSSVKYKSAEKLTLEFEKGKLLDHCWLSTSITCVAAVDSETLDLNIALGLTQTEARTNGAGKIRKELRTL